MACRNDQYPHHHLVRCLSRNMTCPISAVQSQDITIGGTKTGFRSPNCRIFSFLFQHVIRIAFVYSFKGVKFCFSCSSFTFLAKTSAGFLWEQPCTPTFEKKKLTPFESFGCTLRELHTNFLLVKSQIFVGKKLVNTA